MEWISQASVFLSVKVYTVNGNGRRGAGVVRCTIIAPWLHRRSSLGWRNSGRTFSVKRGMILPDSALVCTVKKVLLLKIQIKEICQNVANCLLTEMTKM